MRAKRSTARRAEVEVQTFACPNGHVWERKRDAERCCNGFTRALVLATDPEASEEPAGLMPQEPPTSRMHLRVWIPEDTVIPPPNENEVRS